MIKSIIYLIVIGFSVMNTFAQNQEIGKEDYTWIESLTDEGISIVNDSVHISSEVLRIVEDSAYRSSIYPETYEWSGVVNFIAEKELKKAFWYMINLYPKNDQNKEIVVKALVSYNALFDMTKVLKNTFYTYCYSDPTISKIVAGRPEIHSPHNLDSKLQVLRELTLYLEKYKEESDKILSSMKNNQTKNQSH